MTGTATTAREDGAGGAGAGDEARLGGGRALSKSFRSAVGGGGGGVLRGSMRLSALRRRQREEDRLKLVKEEKKLRCARPSRPHSLTHSLIHSLTRSLTRSLTHSGASASSPAA